MAGEKTEKTQGQMDAEAMERRMEKAMRFACAFCDWEYEATFRAGKTAADYHRQTEHPEAKPSKRKRRGSVAPHLVKRPALTAGEKAEVDEERKRRATLHGVEIDEG